MKLLIATRNRHKLSEIQAIFHWPGLDVVSAFDYPDIPDVVEDGKTLEANAIKKAVTLSLATGLWALADDTGLEVKSLDGAPGVHSARFAGPQVDYAANNVKLLAELNHAPDRTAQFRTVIALSSPTGQAQHVVGVCSGKIIEAPRGVHGFGYDPLFVPDGFDRTFAELEPTEKNRVSHRARALDHAQMAWSTLLATSPTDWP